jgi:hypothetical protein
MAVRPGFAIVRIDEFTEGDESRFTVKRVVEDETLAEREVERLNWLNADAGCRYVWQYTRVDKSDAAS